MFSTVEDLGVKELNKPKGLGHFSCDTPHRLSRWLGMVVRVHWMEECHTTLVEGANNV